MKITLFTSNLSRHNYFANTLAEVATELFVVQEDRKSEPGTIFGHYPNTKIMKDYFSKVMKAQAMLFGDSSTVKENTETLKLKVGDLNKLPLSNFSKFLKSDIYIVFGSSYIKGELVNFLIKNKAINIHMGLSPYYRGTDCNFWALNDNNPHLVGATIHLLSEGVDSGPILYHAVSEIKNDPFVYTMSAVKSAFHSIADNIKNKKIFSFSTESQDKSKEIRYSKKIEFTEKVVQEFLNKKISLKKDFQLGMLKDPYILK